MNSTLHYTAKKIVRKDLNGNDPTQFHNLYPKQQAANKQEAKRSDSNN